MMNPIPPQATSGGGDPELENRVEALEFNIGALQNAHSALVSVDRSGFRSDANFGSASSFLYPDANIFSDLGVLPGQYDFTINDATVSVEVSETDTVFDVLSKITDAGYTVGVYFSAVIFGGQVRVEVSDGNTVSFPWNTSPSNLFRVLGLANYTFVSTPYQAVYSIDGVNIYGQSGTIEDQLFILRNDLAVLSAAISTLAQEIRNLKNGGV
jgi:hypothetical protein